MISGILQNRHRFCYTPPRIFEFNKKIEIYG
jgi:hypothetical protein